MKLQLRRLPREQYPVEPGLYLWDAGHNMENEIEAVLLNRGTSGSIWCESGSWSVAQDEIPDGIAWSQRIECEVVQ